MSQQSIPGIESMPSDWINKHDAAERLKMSWRNVLQLAADGKLKSKKDRDPKSNQRTVLLFAADVERLAYERDHPEESVKTAIAPAVSSKTMLAAGLAAIAGADRQEKRYRPWLTLDEAEEYSGLPKSIILKLAKAGQIRAIDCGPRAGGSWRVCRADLERAGVEGVPLQVAGIRTAHPY